MIAQASRLGPTRITSKNLNICFHEWLLGIQSVRYARSR